MKDEGVIVRPYHPHDPRKRIGAIRLFDEHVKPRAQRHPTAVTSWRPTLHLLKEIS